MDRALDLVQKLPLPVLLGTFVGSVAVPLIVAALIGGSIAVGALLVGAILAIGSGLSLAARVHLDRLPLTLSARGLTTRLDGHPAFQFRAQLGRGRRMDRARATVRFLPDGGGEPVVLEPLMDHGEGLFGPWTLVVVDRHERISGPGTFEVRVTAREGDRAWEAESAYRTDELQPGRFVPALRESRGWFGAAEPFDALKSEDPAA